MSTFQRTGQIVQVLVRHGVLALLDPFGRTDKSKSARLGRRLARALDDLGPTFIKLGQALATREDLLPEGIARELSQLQNQATPISVAEARACIESSLGKPVSQLFASFDDRPLAAGSIAQVHRARTFAGDDVVVKVRRPGIDRTIAADLQLIEGAAQWLSERFPELERHDAVGVAREFGRGLREELDLAREAQAIQEMRGLLRGCAHVPRVFLSLSSEAVLTLEFISGRRVSDVTDANERKWLARQIVASFTTQFLRGTMFHGDPHAGNLVCRPDGRLSMLDFGAVGRIDPPSRRALTRLALAAARGRPDAMATALLDMVHAPPDLSRDSYQHDVGKLLAEVSGRPLGEVNVAALMNQVFAVSRKHGLRFKPEYFALFRSSMLVEGVLRSLDSSLDPLEAARVYIVRSWYRPMWFGPALLVAAASLAMRISKGFRRMRLLLPGSRKPALPAAAKSPIAVRASSK